MCGGIRTYDENLRNSTAFTKEDNRRLQILVNKVLRSLTGLDRDAPPQELHRKSNQLSVNQRCAYFSILLVHKVLQHRQPKYHYEQLVSKQNNRRIEYNIASRIHYNLSISRCSFFYRGSKLYNLLPMDIVDTRNLNLFKKMVKKWTQEKVPVIPP